MLIRVHFVFALTYVSLCQNTLTGISFYRRWGDSRSGSLHRRQYRHMFRLSSTWIHRIFSGYLLFLQCIHVDEMWEPVFRGRHLQKLQLWHWWCWSMSFKYHHYICHGLCDLYVWIQRTVRSKYDSSCNFIAKSKFTNIPNLKVILIIKMRFQFCIY